MHFITILTLLFSICGPAHAIPVTDHSALNRRDTPNYPAQLSSTAPSSVVIRLFSDNPRLNNRNVQLRASSDDGEPLIAAVDPWSPVLLMQLRGGVIYRQKGSFTGTLSDAGPVAYLRNATSYAASGNNTLMEVYFANQTEHTPPTAGFELINVSKDAEYNLYHHVDQDAVVNGFLACEKDNGAYFQLFYYTYTGANLPDFGQGCEYVAVQTTVAPSTP